MKIIKTMLRTIYLLGITLALAQTAFAGDITYVGTWDSTASGNPTGVGGPGLVAGQKYVLRISYNNGSTTTDGVDVLDSFFAPSGNTMRTINLNDAGNSLDIFVPMEGLDSGSPFIYTQNEGDHFPAFIDNPTLNFIDGSDISMTSNIIGLEYEGDFVTGAGNNLIELFNTSPGGSTINMVSQILNLGVGPASNDTNGLVVAVDLIVAAGTNVVYDAASLTQTTSTAIGQSNDLGAMRSDGEDFIDAVWTVTGTPDTTNNNDIAVDIVNSGLTMTTSTTSWNVTMTEQMTLGSDSASVIVSYLNDMPTASASAVATAPGTDFTLTADDMDDVVNSIIAGFEMLTITAEVDGSIDATAFFASLIAAATFDTGMQSYTNFELEAVFGAGLHNVVFLVTDKAGDFMTASADFAVEQAAQVPEPGSLTLMMLGLLMLGIARRRPLVAEL